MDNPFFSVVVIGYNIEQFVSNCVDSILKQTYENFELIFVDDGSVDSTVSIVQKFEDKRVSIICKKNGGIVSARKVGVRKALGKYVVFIDGDDWINKEMLNNMYDLITQTLQPIDILSTAMHRQNEDGSFFTQNSCDEFGVFNGLTYFNKIMDDSACHHMFPKAYKREFLLLAKYLDYPEITMAEDLMSNCFFGLTKPTVMFSNQVNYFYRYNTSSVMRSGSNALLRQKSTLLEMERYLNEFETIPQKKQLLDYQWVSYVYTYMHDEHLSYDMKKDLMKSCKDRISAFNSNFFVQRLFANHPWHINVLFILYYRVPSLAHLFDIIIHFVRSKKRGQREKNRSFHNL